MFAKKALLAALATSYAISSGLAAQESSSDTRFIYKPFGVNPISQPSVPLWSVISSDYTAWVDAGGVFDCTAWAPPENLVDLYENYEQSRECSQLQNRQRVDNLYSGYG